MNLFTESNNNNNNKEMIILGCRTRQYGQYHRCSSTHSKINRWVFRDDLKLDSELEFLSVVGRLFHAKGSETGAIARSPTL